ncbi:MAG: hypothetical protein HBSAPP03_14140 [Phycisphaerae bacterium]|nr:MAG: hypothetical protein HBSAPP03_14140 [Phycisphaerae bacterium]
MNTTHVRICLSLVLGAALWGCANDANTTRKRDADEGVVHTATPEERLATRSTTPVASSAVVLYVNGLGCPLCATNIDKQLLRNRSIATATVDLGAGTVLVTFKEGAAHPTPDRLRNIVEDAGFTLIKVETK